MIPFANCGVQFTVGHPNGENQVLLDLGINDHLVPSPVSWHGKLHSHMAAHVGMSGKEDVWLLDAPLGDLTISVFFAPCDRKCPGVDISFEIGSRVRYPYLFRGLV